MKKLFNSKMACSVLITLAIFMSSCKQDLTVQPNPSVETVKNNKIVDLNIQGMTLKDGMLTFTDYDAYRKAKETLIQTNFESYKAYCQKIGFKSLALLEEDFFNALEKCKTIEEVKALSAANQDILNLSDEQSPILKNTSYNLLRILNRNSMFKINDALYLFDEKGEIIASDGDINNMNQAVIDRRSSKNIAVFNASQIMTRTRCGMENNSGWVRASDRRGIVYANLFYNAYEADYLTYSIETDFSCFARAEKRSIFGWWLDYKTDNLLTITEVKIKIPSQYPTTYPIPATYQFYTNESISTSNSKGVDFIKKVNTTLIPKTLWNSNASSSFEYVDVSYSNRGGVSIDFRCDN